MEEKDSITTPNGKTISLEEVHIYPAARVFESLSDMEVLYLHNCICYTETDAYTPSRYDTEAGRAFCKSMLSAIRYEVLVRAIDIDTGTKLKVETIDLIPR